MIKYYTTYFRYFSITIDYLFFKPLLNAKMLRNKYSYSVIAQKSE